MPPPSIELQDTLAYLDANRDTFRDNLLQFLRIPSISAQPAHAADVRRAAEWLRNRAQRAGLHAEILETAGHPAVFAAGPQSPGRPTLLFYGHHDVQPIGEPALWHRSAFDPAIIDGKVVARGAADDKGQLLCALFAAEAWMRTAGAVPINLKFIIEGEEEIGSPHFGDLVRAERERLACDYVLIHDTAQFAEGVPAITAGTKGLVYKEIILTGPTKDLHSGVYGGQVANPANVLAQLIAAMHAPDGRIAIPGFYDRVAPLSPDEERSIAGLAFDDAVLVADTGSLAPHGEPGYSTLERRWGRPTLDVNGLYGGYMGPGSSTIIPSRAGAKVSMRLVPNMSADAVDRAFCDFLLDRAPKSVRVEILDHAQCDPYVAPLDSPGIRAAKAAIEVGFGRPPVVLREGGTLPILPMFKRDLKADSLLVGYCQPNCNAHSPNEFFHLRDFEAGMRTTAALLRLLRDAR
ncbi:MAG: dipeptidase [Phycisphaerae bacterium]|nr:dipeptidase [Phycisphaerae bacterium]